MFGRLEDEYLEEDQDAEEGKRYLLASGVSVTAPDTIDDEGVTRPPYDLSCYETLNVSGTRYVKLYDRTAWVDLVGLTLADEAPLADRGVMGLAACLATSGAFLAMFGDADLSQHVMLLARQFQGTLSMKAGSTRPTPGADYF